MGIRTDTVVVLTAAITMMSAFPVAAQPGQDNSPFTLHLGGQPNVSNYVELVTNNGSAPLTGIALREINFPNHPGTRIHPVVRCRTHLPAVPIGGRWPIELNVMQEIGENQIAVEGAIFADGTSWGDARAVSKLKEMASKCTGPQF